MEGRLYHPFRNYWGCGCFVFVYNHFIPSGLIMFAKSLFTYFWAYPIF